MSQRTKIYVLVALLLIAVYAYFAERSVTPGMQGVLASDSSFHPLERRRTASPPGSDRKDQEARLFGFAPQHFHFWASTASS